jgi:transcriptional regulator with XRE-family HTH domain
MSAHGKSWTDEGKAYAFALGGKLREVRRGAGLSLEGVEVKSGGRWKAVVVGSYERGDRALSVPRLAELADFYQVPAAELLPDAAGSVPQSAVEQAARHARLCSDLLAKATAEAAPTLPPLWAVRHPGIGVLPYLGERAARSAAGTAGTVLARAADNESWREVA